MFAAATPRARSDPVWGGGGPAASSPVEARMTPSNPADLMQTPAPTPLPSPLIARTYGEPRFHTDGDIAAVAFAADGTLRSVDETGVLKHWSADGHLLRRAYLSDLETVWAFAPGGELLASGNDDLLLWDVAAGRLAHRHVQPAWVTAIGFGPDGKLLVSGHDDGSVKLWDAVTHAAVADFDAHPAAVSAVAVSPSGAHIATAGEDRVVRVWNAASRALVHEFKSHTDRIPALAWAADGTLLVSAGWDTSARVWRMGQTDPVILLNSHAEQVLCAAFAPAGGLLATADSDYDIYLWSDPAAGQVGKVLRGHVDEVRTLTFSPDGSRLASGGADRVVHVWDVATGQLVAGPNPAGRHGIAAFPTSDGRTLLASTGGPEFRVWDAATGDPADPADPAPAHSVAASPDGRWLAVGGTDHFVRLHDLANSATPARKLEATKPPIGAVAVHPTGELVAHTSPADGLAWVWDTTTAEPKLILIEAADGCTLETVAFHPDGHRVAVGGIDYLSTGDRDGAVCVWDLRTQQKEITFDSGVYAVAFDPTGRYLGGAGINDMVYLWDMTSHEVVFALEGHQEKIHALAFSPDGSFLVSGGDDMTVRVWDTLGGRLMVAREFDSPIQALAFSPDGTSLFTGNGNTTCHRVDFKKLLDD